MNAESARKATDNCCDGTPAEVSGNRSTSTRDQGADHHHTMVEDADITCAGKAGERMDREVTSTICTTICQAGDEKTLAIDGGQHIPKKASHQLDASCDRRWFSRLKGPL